MAIVGRRKSFSESLESRRKATRFIFLILLALAGLDSFRATFLSSHEIGSRAMEPTLYPGEKILATPLPFGPRTVFGKLPLLIPPSRGDIVLILPPGRMPIPFGTRLADSILRLLTFQKMSLLQNPIAKRTGGMFRDGDFPGRKAAENDPSLVLKRVIALPGDSIFMEDGIYRIRTPGSSIYLTEKEITDKRRYTADSEIIIPGWVADLPGSGTMSEITLGSDEYFLSGDSRNGSSDSRLWGPLRSEALVALVLLRYWPPGKLGQP